MPSQLFSAFTLRELTFKNRVFVSPMCQYSAEDGMPNDWHLVHLGSRAVGGAGCIIQEATAVSPEGRITPADAGIWNDEQMNAWKKIVHFIKENGAVPGIQLAHAGRKASKSKPWLGDKSINASAGGWDTILAPSPLPFDPTSTVPKEISLEEIKRITDDFVAAAKRALTAGYEVIELHAAHGYLLHEFLSPLSNKRTDAYGGSLENRMRFALEVAEKLRNFWPAKWPVFVRISASDWTEGGWDIASSVELAKRLKALGIDLIDCSSGGNVYDAKIPAGPGYQVPFAQQVRTQSKIATGAVGMIMDAAQAEQIIVTGQADIVLLARQSLRDPYWPLHAARELHTDLAWPVQYDRAKLK